MVASLAVVIAGTGLLAHRRDEYLQAARLALEQSRVECELDLTPGIDVAASIVATIDADGDASLSGDEQRAYASQVVAALQVTLDGTPLELRLISLNFPEPSAFYQGEGTIRLEIHATHPGLAPGAHRLLFRNGYRSGQSAYLANALVPENARMSVTGQRRDSLQSELTIDYLIRGGASGASPAGWLLVGLPFAAVLVLRFRKRTRGVRNRPAAERDVFDSSIKDPRERSTVHRDLPRNQGAGAARLDDEIPVGAESVGTLVFNEYEGKTTLTMTIACEMRAKRDALLKIRVDV